MARKRRTRYTWLPNTGTQGPGADIEDTSSARDFGNILVPINGTTSIVIIDLLNDEPPEETQVIGLPMGVTLGSEYFIKRIVGKFFAELDRNEGVTTLGAWVGAGIFIARAEDTDSAAGNFVPIGALTQAQAVDNYSPLRQEVIREPWIWRRTWILGNPDNAGLSGTSAFPRSTAEYGSVQDGPHIDAKTARRVGNDDRLWMVVAARSYPLNTTGDANLSLRAMVDYRVLGQSRRAKNRSAF